MRNLKILSWSVGCIERLYVCIYYDQMSAYTKIGICFEVGCDDFKINILNISRQF